MSAAINSVRTALDQFRDAVAEFGKAIDGLLVPLELPDDARAEANFGELQNLAFAINDMRDHLDADSTPSWTDFKDALNIPLMQAFEELRAEQAKAVAAAASQLIDGLRATGFMTDFDNAPALERLEIYRSLSEVAVDLDMHDPDTGTDQRYLQDAAAARATILTPTRVGGTIAALPSIIATDTNALIDLTDPNARAFFRRVTGTAPSDSGASSDAALKWTTTALAQLGGLMNVLTSIPGQQLNAADAMFALYSKVLVDLPGFSDVQAANGPVAKLEKMSEILSKEAGFRVTPSTRLGKAHLVISKAGLPLGLFDGLMKTNVALQKLFNATSGTDVATESINAVGTGTKLIAEALETFGSKVTKEVAGRVAVLITIPLVAFEVIAAVKGVDKALLANDLSVALGQGLLGAGAVAGTALAVYAKFAVAASAGGPIGLAVAVAGGIILGITLIGIYLVEFTKDPKLETFAFQCIFGNGMANWSASSADEVSFGFGTPAAPNVAVMIERLRSLRGAVGFRSEAGSSGGARDYLVTHGFVGTSDEGKPFRDGATTRLRFVQDPVKNATDVPVPDFNDAEFRQGGQTLVVGTDSNTETPEAWIDGWMRLEVTWSGGQRELKTYEYAKIPSV